MTSIAINPSLLEEMHRDLDRPHEFAAERVGFLICESKFTGDIWTITAERYVEIPDDEYEYNPRVGACISANAFRRVRATAHIASVSIFHVHRHDHRGRPGFSTVDVQENERFLPDFSNVRPELPHGAIVLSFDSACAAFLGPGQSELRQANVLLQEPSSIVEVQYEQPTQSPKFPGGNIGSDYQKDGSGGHWFVRWWVARFAAIGAYWRR